MFRTAVAAFLLVSLLAAAQSPQPPGRPQAQAESRDDNPPTPDSKSASGIDAAAPAVPTISCITTAPNEKQACEHAGDGDGERNEAFWIKVTAFATVFLFGVTGLLWWATKRLVNVSEVTAQRTLRAYISQVSGKLDSKSIAQGIRATVVVRNGGPTPASNVSMWIRITIGKHPLDSTLKPGDHSKTLGRSIMGPKAKVSMTASAKADQAMQIDLDAGKIAVYVYGEVSYRDIYDIARVTRFRLIHGGPHKVTDAVLRHCDEGNEAT